MRPHVVDFIGPGHEVAVEVAERPDRVVFRIDRFGDLTHLPGDLGIASEVVDKLGIRRSKKPLTDRPIARLSPGPTRLRTGVVRQQIG